MTTHTISPGTGTGLAAIAAERTRQIEAKGWTPEHDDQHPPGTLARAGASFCLSAFPRDLPDASYAAGLWPWGDYPLNPQSQRADLVRAGALIAAEIDRMDRKNSEPTT